MCYEQTVKARENIAAWWEGELLEDRVCADYQFSASCCCRKSIIWP